MRLIIGLAALIGSSTAAAEVVRADGHGFHVRQTVQLVVPAGEALNAFARVASWWPKEHTYSGSAANLSMDVRPGGCFCERFPEGGGIEHLRVTYVKPGEDIMFTGALGPLLNEAVAGVMSVHVERIAGGSQLTIDYRAAGFADGGADKMAPMVDGMLSQTASRFRAFAATGGGKQR